VTTLCALLGFPVEHSRSPSMHNAAFRALGMDWRYEAIAVEPDRFQALVHGLPERGFVGANVTIPHKLRALEVADDVSATARAVGAANTLSFSGGRIVADNTDVTGFLTALAERAPGGAPAGMKALVLGAGGAARAVVYALLAEGAERVLVWNRHPDRARALVAELGHGAGGRLEAAAEPDPRAAGLVVNATSVGMEGESDDFGGAMRGFKDLRLSVDDLREQQVIVDLVYRDGGTPLVREARMRGLRCVDGFDVLVHQGAASFAQWTGRAAPLEAMRDGARKRN
jgi:shikimate dehydrogenase